MAIASIGRAVRGMLISERRLHAVRSAVDTLPAGVRRTIGALLHFSAARLGDLVDGAEHLTGRHDPLMPPRRMIFVGSNSIVKADYRAIGRELVGMAVRFAGVEPASAILEVGSGTGRIAASLTSLLSPAGRYEGFEIVSKGVQWCRANITPRFPQFHFTHADVYNKFYNAAGRDPAATYRFPYEDASFDVVLATSVLTHMYRADAAHYLSEVSRVLRSGGRSFITHFLSTPESTRAVAEGRGAMRFVFPVPDGLTVDAARPEAAIAVDSAAVRADYERAGLRIDQIHTGRWTGSEGGVHFQDIVVARKP